MAVTRPSRRYGTNVPDICPLVSKPFCYFALELVGTDSGSRPLAREGRQLPARDAAHHSFTKISTSTYVCRSFPRSLRAQRRPMRNFYQNSVNIRAALITEEAS